MTGNQARSHHEDKAGLTERELSSAVDEMVQGYLAGRLQRADTGHLIDELQRLIERRYPNPERAGCPNIEILIQLTKGSLVCAFTIEHVTRCAPCFHECVDLLNRKVRDNSR